MSSEQRKPPSTGKSEPPRAPGLLRSSGVVGMMTMLSRVLGLVRDMVIARYFGAGAGADAFFVAFKIPNFLRRLFAEGAFSAGRHKICAHQPRLVCIPLIGARRAPAAAR